MDSCDVLIVGGGPAGSSCAWSLRRSGLDVAILDRQVFPRDKICGGWITPRALSVLDIGPAEYGAGRVLQPITAFKTGCIGASSSCEINYEKPVSYGILRREFDDYLLKRCSARLYQGNGVKNIERTSIGWNVNGAITARLLVGAGGHFCPVARHVCSARRDAVVVAQEAEFEMPAELLAGCRVRGTMPELYFCADMKGYGWCFRKRDFLNIGIGRADPHGLPLWASRFLRFAGPVAGVPTDIPALRGHAYMLYGMTARRIAGDAFLLAGDAAGLAYQQSGEGILPAIESGLLAAETIIAARGDYARAKLEPYAWRIAQRFGAASRGWLTRLGRSLPSPLISLAARRLMSDRRFVRICLLDRSFLHRADEE